MLVRAPYTFLFVLAVCCWFRYNAAVPLSTYLSNKDAFKEKKTDSETDLDDTTSRSMRDMETLDVTSDEDDEDDEDDENDENNEIPNKSKQVNRNVNMNMNIFDRGDRYRNRDNDVTRNRDERYKQSTTENIMAVKEQGTLEEIGKEEVSTNCPRGNKKNQRYSSSFLANSTDHTLTVDKEFHDVVGNNSKVKKSGSVHEGEDITLCWIETTTIKEDKTIRPPKRLVIREYTISFENSATIPERYLECKRFEGELTADDPDIGKTALFEVIDEDTMVSRIVNFTSVNHAGNVITWEHKKVKCGVGPVVSKNIVELTDDSKNPKKRVEIKVSPKMHQLTATTTDEEEPCTESSEATDESSTLTESITEHTTELSCENSESGACETTITSPSISSKTDKVSTSEEVTRLQSKPESESDDRLPTATKSSYEVVSRRSTSSPKKLIQESQEKIDCDENSLDPACLTQKHGTSSSEELFPELTTTEISTMKATETSSINDREITTKEEIFRSTDEETTQSLFTSREEKELTSDLVTEETTPLVTDISMESSEAPQSTDQASDDTGLSKTKITSTTEDVEEYPKLKEGSGETSIELTSEELEDIDYVPSSSIMTSGKVEPEVTTAISPVRFTEFTKESKKPDQILDKLSESPISTESVSETTGSLLPTITEFSSTSEEVPSKESKESITSSIEETTVGLRASEEGEFIPAITTMLPTKVKSTTLSPATRGDVSYSCENSEECASTESCDESGNCGETTTKCDSEVCSEEEVIEDQSKFDRTSPPTLTKVPLSATDLQSSEESAMIETEYTTVTNIATTMLPSQESENISGVNVPTTDTRRSTTISTLRHKLKLKFKVLLEHIDENKEKHNLVEVEKHLLLDENPERHDNPDLLEQLKSLNDSVNMETLSALLNCTSLGNLTRDPNFVSKEPEDGFDDNDVDYTNSDLEDSEQFNSESVDAKNDYSDYQERKIPSRKRSRKSLGDEMEAANRFIRELSSTDSVLDSFNMSQTQPTEVMRDNLLSTTTSRLDEVTTEIDRNVTTEENLTTEGNVTTQENVTTEGNATTEGDQSTMPSTVMSIINYIDLSNTSESNDANVTNENIQLTTTTYKPEGETTNTVDIESEKNMTNEKNESTVPSMRDDINNETKMQVVQKTLPGIQEDVVVGLQHMVSQLALNNLTSANNIKETVNNIKTTVVDILDAKNSKILSRRRRAATEEVGHWSNERIKEAPMGGNLRSLTEFTLYKVLP